MDICSYTGPKSAVCAGENAHFPLKSGERNTRGVLGDGGGCYFRTKWKLSFGYYDYRNIFKASG